MERGIRTGESTVIYQQIARRTSNGSVNGARTATLASVAAIRSYGSGENTRAIFERNSTSATATAMNGFAQAAVR